MKNVAVVGCGAWGKNIVRTFHGLGVLWGVADSSEKNLQAQQERFPDINAVSSVEEVLSDDSVKAIAIATPAPMHYEVAKKALDAGRHVFVEKPFTLDIDECEELKKIAEEKQLVIMVGHLMLYHQGIREMKKLLDNNDLGDLVYLYGQRLNLGKVRQDENALWSLGPHDISICLYLFEQMPKSVSAVGSCFLQPKLGVEDVVFMNMLFEDGHMANIHLSWLDPHKIRRLTLVGSKKMAVLDDGEATEKLRIYDKGVDGIDLNGEYENYGESLTLRTGDILIPKLPTGEPLKLELSHFLKSIETGQKPLSDAQNGIDVLKVLIAADKSIKKGGIPVEIS